MFTSRSPTDHQIVPSGSSSTHQMLLGMTAASGLTTSCAPDMLFGKIAVGTISMIGDHSVFSDEQGEVLCIQLKQNSLRLVFVAIGHKRWLPRRLGQRSTQSRAGNGAKYTRPCIISSSYATCTPCQQRNWGLPQHPLPPSCSIPCYLRQVSLHLSGARLNLPHV